MTKMSFSIENMKCAGCVAAIEAALTTLGEVDDINISLEEHQATVSSSKTAEDVAKVITDAGFPATPL